MAGEPIPPTVTGAAGQTSIIALWVPVVVFAHAFAAFWLAKTWLLNSPGLQRKARAHTRVATKLVRRASQKVAASIKPSASKAHGGALAAVGSLVKGPGLDAGASGGDQVSIQVRRRRRGTGVGGGAARRLGAPTTRSRRPQPRSLCGGPAPGLPWSGRGARAAGAAPQRRPRAPDAPPRATPRPRQSAGVWDGRGGALAVCGRVQC
jgi:hypothetical protein